jgi:hypothetical protein
VNVAAQHQIGPDLSPDPCGSLMATQQVGSFIGVFEVLAKDFSAADIETISLP